MLAAVIFSHALPRGRSGVGGLGIKQRQGVLVQSETTGGLTESSLQTTVYTHLELPFNLF